ncbi:MAG: diacylglycerol/lipid kinase family protein [Flavobacteriales bacterium]
MHTLYMTAEQQTKQIVFIVHGAKPAAVRMVHELRNRKVAGWHFQFRTTNARGHATRLVSEVAEHADVIAAIGGDGTLNECVHGLMHWQQGHNATMPALALLPCGSGNDFARHFGWQKSVDHFIERLHTGSFTMSDVGCMQSHVDSHSFFINECSLGLSTDVVGRIERMPLRFSGNIKFGWAILCAFITYRKKYVSIKTNDWQWSGQIMMVCIANGKFLGSGVSLAPDAEVNDGLLHITIIGNVSVMDYLRYLPALRSGKKIDHKEVHYFSAPELWIASANELETDGEMAVSTPAHISLHPAAISVLL